MSAPRRRWPISARSTPTVSILPTIPFRILRPSPSRPRLAAAEIRLGTSLITYAHHAQLGRVHWSRVSADISYDRKAPEPGEVLGKMAEAKDAKDVSEALAAYEPQVRPYLVLKAKLAELRAGKGDGGKTAHR